MGYDILCLFYLFDFGGDPDPDIQIFTSDSSPLRDRAKNDI